MKSDHKYYNFTIPYEELNNFIEPVKANIFIPYYGLENILQKDNDLNLKTYKYINNIYFELFKLMPELNEQLKDKYSYVMGITYNSHINGYDFRFNPIDIVNKIYEFLDLDYKIPFINLDSEMGLEYFKQYVKNYNLDIKRLNPNSKICDIIDEINSNINNIINLYYEDLEKNIKGSIIPKDALFYIAYSSLRKFEETNDPTYMIYALEYYDNVSDMTTSDYPHMVCFDYYYNSIFKGFDREFHSKIWYNDFRKDFESIKEKVEEIDKSNYFLAGDEVLLAWEILKPGMVEREIRDIVQRVKHSPNVDYKKYQKLFEMKMNFYMQSDYIKYIKGLYGLLGYVGFSYKNEYLIFDKFHNSETIDPSKKTILTHGEAIYALPSDKFSILSTNKQAVIEEKNKDERIRKINHTINGSFLDRLDNVVKSPNVSTSTFDAEINDVKRKMLIKKY